MPLFHFNLKKKILSIFVWTKFFLTTLFCVIIQENRLASAMKPILFSNKTELKFWIRSDEESHWKFKIIHFFFVFIVISLFNLTPPTTLGLRSWHWMSELTLDVWVLRLCYWCMPCSCVCICTYVILAGGNCAKAIEILIVLAVSGVPDVSSGTWAFFWQTTCVLLLGNIWLVL